MTPVQTLAGKEIVIAVTGSIAAVETVKLIHALRRKGAEVQPVMSHAATEIVSPDALTYASGRPAITRLSGLVEHVTYCGDGGSADLLLIAPCTANTISKIACGIDDTPVTTFATTALGSGMPVLLVPAMHHSMYRHPAIGENLRKIRGWGVGIADPRIEEEKAKIAGIDEIVLACERAILGKPLAGKRVVLTSGPCRESVDDVRILTTRSSGQMGRELALQAFRLGADVTVIHGDTFPCVRNVRAASAEEMRTAVNSVITRAEKADIYISAAAVSDFAPKRHAAKIPSGKPATIVLEPLPKILDDVLERGIPVVVAFKLGREPEEKAGAMIEKGVSLVLMNPPETMGSDRGDYVALGAQGRTPVSGTKEEIAAAVWEILLRDHIRTG